ncbi:hypothetical protein IWQ56_004722 [Coemansia nantahalensis]|nr:hypothetical protein IWQ56_004722 [Coemansia nantahalensis]
MFPGGDVLVAPVPLRAVNPGRLVRPPVTAADTAAYAVAAAPPSQPPPPAAAPRTPFVEISDLAIGDAEAIPSIGRFRSLRALYQFRQRVSEYEHEHGRRWRERMESRRRQNWSRISAIYNRIVQLCGPDGSDAGVERALQAAEREMEASGATLTRYSQIVRKQLNRERRQSLQEASPSHGPAAPARHHPGSGSGSDASGLPVAGLAI